MKRFIEMVLRILFVLFIFYLGIVSTIYRFKHPEMTETELFLDLPKAFILNF